MNVEMKEVNLEKKKVVERVEEVVRLILMKRVNFLDVKITVWS